jgi:hypothetical protein
MTVMPDRTGTAARAREPLLARRAEPKDRNPVSIFRQQIARRRPARPGDAR